MSDTSTLRKSLAEVECFADLDDRALLKIEQMMQTRSYYPDAIISNEGDAGDWAFIVARGDVVVIKEAEGGSPVRIATLQPGDWGGMMSLFERAPRSATLQAKGDVELWVLSHDIFQELLDDIPGMASGMLQFLSRRLRHDSFTLASTLQYVDAMGLEAIYRECSPQERLILDTINQRISGAESLDEIMNFLYESIGRVGACDRLSLAFIVEDGARVVSHWTRSVTEPLVLPDGYAADLQVGSLQQVLDSGKPRVINDLAQYLKAHPDSIPTRHIVAEGMRSSMTCPLIVMGRPIGFLFRNSRQTGAFDDHQVQLHGAIARSIGQAVEKAYRIEELTEANRAYTEMVGFISHELRSPVASMVTDARLLLGGYLGDLTEKQRDKVKRSIDKGEYLLSLVREYLTLDQMDSGLLTGNMQPDINFIDRVANPAIDIVDAQSEAKGMTIVRHYSDDCPTIECDPDLMTIAMVNLVGNAVKYGFEKGEVRVTVAPESDQLRVTVWNEGPGFAKEQRAQLFRKFSRLDSPELKKQKGTGVGLYSTWRIINLHHGRIGARSTLSEWAEFYFAMPLAQPPEAAADESEGESSDA